MLDVWPVRSAPQVSVGPLRALDVAAIRERDRALFHADAALDDARDVGLDTQSAQHLRTGPVRYAHDGHVRHQEARRALCEPIQRAFVLSGSR